MPELTLPEKVQIASEIATEILVGILRRRAQVSNTDIGTLLAGAAAYSQEADRILDELEGIKPAEGGD